MKLNWTEHRAVLIIAVAALLLPLWYFFVYQSQIDKETVLNAERDSMMQRIKSVKKNIGETGAVAVNLRKMEMQWGQLAGHLAAPDSADQILHHIRDVARGNKLTILDAQLDMGKLYGKTSDNHNIASINKIELKLEGRGRFFNIGNFLDSLENDVSVADLEKLKLVYQRPIDPEIYFSMSVDIFVLPPEEKVL